ncbi:MAG: ECF transporter S component [Ruminococcaceae bacterium]|nr:ECF transporter S component [Oscillospiraceae bacterium]
MNKRTKQLAFAAMCLALALVLPFLTGQIPEIGSALSPMHIPALLCGFICGPIWGAIVGAVAPLLRYLLFSMPPLMAAIPMAFELAVYGLAAGLLYRLLPKNILSIYVSLIGAMAAGRIVWGIVKVFMSVIQVSEFTFSAFIAGAITGAIPGIICHILLIPLIVMALRRARLMPE